MAKAGIIEEMMQDAMDSVMDSEDLEDETEEQVRRTARLAPCSALPCFVLACLDRRVGLALSLLGRTM